MRIDAGADGGAALRETPQARLHTLEAGDAVLDLLTPGRQLLADRHRHRVHQVRAARLHDVADFLFLFFASTSRASFSAGSRSFATAIAALT